MEYSINLRYELKQFGMFFCVEKDVNIKFHPNLTDKFIAEGEYSCSIKKIEINLIFNNINTTISVEVDGPKPNVYSRLDATNILIDEIRYFKNKGWYELDASDPEILTNNGGRSS